MGDCWSMVGELVFRHPYRNVVEPHFKVHSLKLKAFSVLLIAAVQLGCNNTSDFGNVDDLWWIQHMGKLSVDGYVPGDGPTPWLPGLSLYQRSILQDADAAIFFKLRESLPEHDNDFGSETVLAWKRVTNREVVKPLIEQLSNFFDNDKTFYPDSFQAEFGARIWRKKEAVDLIISISQRLVHVKDKREHRYCEIPKGEAKKLARSLAALDWKERHKLGEKQRGHSTLQCDND